MIQKGFGKIEEAAESSVGNPSLMVGFFIIGLLAFRSNHRFGIFTWRKKEEWEGLRLQLYVRYAQLKMCRDRIIVANHGNQLSRQIHQEKMEGKTENRQKL